MKIAILGGTGKEGFGLGFRWAAAGHEIMIGSRSAEKGERPQEYAVTPSMSRRANCWDNAPMENLFGHLKEEALRQVRNPTFEEARLIIDDYISFYNYERLQLKTRQTPYETRCLST